MQNKSNYITITEASQLVGKHKDTIRRLIKTNVGSPHIVKGKKGQYLVDSYWLKSQYGLDEAPEAPTAGANQQDDKEPSTGSIKAISAVVEALTAQLDAKDKQIESLQVIIKEKEDNTTKLQDQFQQLLASAQLPAKTQSREPYEAKATEPKEPSKPKPKKAAPKKKKQAKKAAPKQEPNSKKKWWQR